MAYLRSQLHIIPDSKRLLSLESFRWPLLLLAVPVRPSGPCNHDAPQKQTDQSPPRRSTNAAQTPSRSEDRRLKAGTGDWICEWSRRLLLYQGGQDNLGDKRPADHDPQIHPSSWRALLTIFISTALHCLFSALETTPLHTRGMRALLRQPAVDSLSFSSLRISRNSNPPPTLSPPLKSTGGPRTQDPGP
jgi:hypothetical protein